MYSNAVVDLELDQMTLSVYYHKRDYYTVVNPANCNAKMVIMMMMVINPLQAVREAAKSARKRTA